MTAIVENTKFLARSASHFYPSLYFGLRRLLGKRRGFAVRRTTDLVIEGYPRSATSFAVTAFRYAQDTTELSIAHHLHSTAQIIRAQQYAIPTMLLIRDPLESVSSLLVRNPHLKANIALRSYYLFYYPILRGTPTPLIAPFREVTDNFGLTISRFNATFNLDYQTFAHTTRREQEVLAQVDQYEAHLSDKSVRTAVPTEAKEIRKRTAKDTVTSKYPSLLRKNQELYNRYLDLYSEQIQSYR